MADPLYCPWFIGAPCLKPEVWAAWAQALLSVAAIGASYWLATRQRRIEVADRTKAEALAARSFALVILREMKVLLSRLQSSRNDLPNDFVETRGYPAKSAEIPQGLWDNASQMHILGDASEHVLQCMYRLQESREHIAGKILWGDEGVHYRNQIDASIGSAQDAIRQLHLLID